MTNMKMEYKYCVTRTEYYTDVADLKMHEGMYDLAICDTREQAEILVSEALQEDADNFMDWLDEEANWIKRGIYTVTDYNDGEQVKYEIEMIPYYYTDAS